MIQRLDEGSPPIGEERTSTSARARCPTCGARRREEVTCSRCRSDLRLLLALEARADRLSRDALSAYNRGHYRTAMACAGALVRLETTPTALRLLAVSALRAGDFATAVRVARRAVALAGNAGSGAPSGP